MRIMLAEGEDGDRLWAGMPVDRPFHVQHDTQLSQSEFDALAALPAFERGSRLNCGVRGGVYTASQMLKLEAPSQSSVRAPPAAGDEVPVAGVIQWYVSEDSTGEWYMHYGGRAQTRKKALEFVSGCYSPSTRCVCVCGTHMSESGKDMLALDCYELCVSEDGMRMDGVTEGNDGVWAGRVATTSSQLHHEAVEGVEFDDLTKRGIPPPPYTQT